MASLWVTPTHLRLSLRHRQSRTGAPGWAQHCGERGHRAVDRLGHPHQAPLLQQLQPGQRHHADQAEPPGHPQQLRPDGGTALPLPRGRRELHGVRMGQHVSQWKWVERQTAVFDMIETSVFIQWTEESETTCAHKCGTDWLFLYPSAPDYPTDNFPDRLQCLRQPIIDDRICKNAYPHLFTDNMVCSGFMHGGASSCQVSWTTPRWKIGMWDICQECRWSVQTCKRCMIRLGDVRCFGGKKKVDYFDSVAFSKGLHQGRDCFRSSSTWRRSSEMSERLEYFSFYIFEFLVNIIRLKVGDERQ